ncbi:hypothetical protein P153DRAFT_282504 [Dothidotthia symphoricarpi CBS 119687]|uniref:Uncharacterized protein n=1 Tax=Dothidotthia symphoricarpi CBS 119687 TaxID=1392245 RepID=A0A6A6AQN2_9PLEO|nr:uncharacterized protein P153DRAFT_282504 [Dothidotthia symphoricarpi CBS 119687]KAF2133513.1 hypothetical protein P153DRAFT_282504 [Dothidotthia symphoricarpi CBS 119687]
MQSASAKRAFSALAAKIHPQLPLTKRESQQLLNLLTTSFRNHLDREHPFSPQDSIQNKPTNKSVGNNGQRSSSPIHATSSYASTSKHIDSILTNPLFAVKPRRRGSESAAVDVLRDPMGWFLDQIAVGAASLPKAAMCLEVLESTAAEASPQLQNGKTPGVIIAEWLRASGLDTSKDFLDLCTTKQGRSSKFQDRLVSLLLSEGAISAPWRWYIRPTQQRIKDTGLDVLKVSTFRQQLLAKMVSVQGNTGLDNGLAVFMQAFRMAEVEGHESAYSVLRAAGARLVNRVISTPDHSTDVKLYESFLLSSQRWLGNWSQAVESMLWLHHPTQRSALPGLRFIQDPAGAISFVRASKSRRNFLVQLCLGVARQLLEEEKFTEAQIAMEFTKQHFPDIVLSKPSVADQPATTGWKAREERKNLELLDRLVLS